jgi:hypothetical protein
MGGGVIGAGQKYKFSRRIPHLRDHAEVIGKDGEMYIGFHVTNHLCDRKTLDNINGVIGRYHGGCACGDAPLFSGVFLNAAQEEAKSMGCWNEYQQATRTIE